MLKNVLGAMIPKDRMDLLARIASRMAADNPVGKRWCKRFEEVLKKNWPSSKGRDEKMGKIVTEKELKLGMKVRNRRSENIGEIQSSKVIWCRSGGYVYVRVSRPIRSGNAKSKSISALWNVENLEIVEEK